MLRNDEVTEKVDRQCNRTVMTFHHRKWLHPLSGFQILQDSGVV
jgi:hypothetical protein